MRRSPSDELASADAFHGGRAGQQFHHEPPSSLDGRTRLTKRHRGRRNAAVVDEGLDRGLPRVELIGRVAREQPQHHRPVPTGRAVLPGRIDSSRCRTRRRAGPVVPRTRRRGRSRHAGEQATRRRPHSQSADYMNARRNFNSEFPPPRTTRGGLGGVTCGGLVLCLLKYARRRAQLFSEKAFGVEGLKGGRGAPYWSCVGAYRQKPDVGLEGYGTRRSGTASAYSTT